MSLQQQSFLQIQDDLAQFDSIIDVRSPAEYAADHLPGSLNLPVLSDAQRAQVGTLYVQQSPFEARRVGAALVARNIAQHLEAALSDRPREWKPLVYCWRGGERSASLAHVLARVGWRVTQLAGGYKGYRRAVIDGLDTLCTAFQYRVLCGPTGSGKSRLLGALEAQGAQVLDLERLAAHRGSVLGSWPDHQEQPGQRRFESLLWQTLRSFRSDLPVYVEAESRKVGDLRVPVNLSDALRASSCIRVRLALEERVRLLLEDYAHLIAQPDALLILLGHLTARHGQEVVSMWQGMVRNGNWDALVRSLLAVHYDPAYGRSSTANFARMESAVEVDIRAAEPASIHETARRICLAESAALALGSA